MNYSEWRLKQLTEMYNNDNYKKFRSKLLLKLDEIDVIQRGINIIKKENKQLHKIPLLEAAIAEKMKDYETLLVILLLQN